MVLDYGDNWWTEYNMDTHQGMATTLLAAGVDVFWFGDTGENPYAYIHSKVAVRDNEVFGSVPATGNLPPILNQECLATETGVSSSRITALASMVQQHLGYDEDGNKNHITPVSLRTHPTVGQCPPPEPLWVHLVEASQPITTLRSWCVPTPCIDDLVTMLADADEEILLSLNTSTLIGRTVGARTPSCLPLKMLLSAACAFG